MTKPKTMSPTRANFHHTAKEAITANTKVTICPGYQPRFVAVSVPFVRGANQSGRVLKVEG